MLNLKLATPPKSPEVLVSGVFQNPAATKGNAKSQGPTAKLSSLKDYGVTSNDPLLNGFSGGLGESAKTQQDKGIHLLIGLGESDKADLETLRRTGAHLYKGLPAKSKKVFINFDSFLPKKMAKNSTSSALQALLQGLQLASYEYNKYKNDENLKSSKSNIEVNLFSSKLTKAIFDSEKKSASNLVESVFTTRDLVNSPPNDLNSVQYANFIKKDVTQNLKSVKVKILNKAAITKEKMNLLLAVNAGSAYEPRLVHLSYTPVKKTKNSKHIALVGKGITFDTGGYSLKPGSAMMGMKFDMGGSATVYGAFRAAVLNKSPNKITCVLAMTDNAVSSLATMPDSVIKARNGKTVEILNTDAEGRLILADALDYTCDLKPDIILDAATLTGACLVALGKEVPALLGNNQDLADGLLAEAKSQGEYLWQLPIVSEFRKEMKSKIADYRNIGSGRFAGTCTAAAFLEFFIKNDIKWAHFDIAGVCDSQSHLPYCPATGGSGVMVRTLSSFLMKA